MNQELFKYAFQNKSFNDFCYEGGYFESKNLEYLCEYYNTPTKQSKLIETFKHSKGGYRSDLQKIIEDDFKADFLSTKSFCMKDTSFVEWRSLPGNALKYHRRDGGMTAFRAYFSDNKFKLIEILTENKDILIPRIPKTRQD